MAEVVKMAVAEERLRVAAEGPSRRDSNAKFLELLDLLRQRKKLRILKPGDRALLRWDLVVIALFAFTSIVTPFEVTFLGDDNAGVRYDALFFLNRLVDFGYLLDMSVQFSLAYEDAEGCLVLNRSAIAKRYLRTEFPLDFISLLPYDVLSVVVDRTQFDVAQIRQLRMLRLLRLLRIVKLLGGDSAFGRMQAQLKISFALQVTRQTSGPRQRFPGL
jgi:potassium voltage-gated channel Eag-related subfamily H protein 7